MKSTSPKPLKRLADAFGVDHFLGVFVMLIFLIFLAPGLERQFGIRWLLDAALGVVLVLTILSLAGNRWVVLSGLVLAGIGYGGLLLNAAGFHPAFQIWSDSALVLFFVLASILIFRYVLQTRRVTANTIWAALCVYLFIGLLWSIAYVILMYMNPETFLAPEAFLTAGQRLGFSEFIYYSFVTLTTLGYGDITPVSESARALSSLEAVIGQMYMTVLVARLVGMHIAFATANPKASDPDAPDSRPA